MLTEAEFVQVVRVVVIFLPAFHYLAALSRFDFGLGKRFLRF